MMGALMLDKEIIRRGNAWLAQISEKK